MKHDLSPKELAAFRAERAELRNRINAEVRAQLRDGFQRVLVDLLCAAPSQDDLEEMAKANPYKWAMTLDVIAQLSGYQRNATVISNQTNILHVTAMSDVALMQRLNELELQYSSMKSQASLPHETSNTQARPHKSSQMDEQTIDVTATVVTAAKDAEPEQ